MVIDGPGTNIHVFFSDVDLLVGLKYNNVVDPSQLYQQIDVELVEQQNFLDLLLKA